MPQLNTPPRLRGFDYASERSYFVTFCVQDRALIFADPALAGVTRDILLDYRARGWYWLWAYCIMPDHIHLVLRLRPQRRLLSRVIGSIKNRVTKTARECGRDFKWQFGFFDHVIRSHETPDYFVKYVMLNPVRAGLVTDPMRYPFCGIVDMWK